MTLIESAIVYHYKSYSFALTTIGRFFTFIFCDIYLTDDRLI